MAKGSNTKFIKIAITLLIACIMIPIVVNEVLLSEQEVSTITKSTYLYPQTDGSLAKTAASSGTYTVDCSATGNKTLKLTTITLSGLHSGLESLDASTWTFNYNASIDDASMNVSLYVDIYVVFSNDTIRDTIKKGAAYSAYHTGTTEYTALSGTYSFAKYTVQDTTDKLRIDWMVDVKTGGTTVNTTLSLPESKFGLVHYTYESQSEGWGFTGGGGARTLFLLLPFIFIIGVVVYFIGSLLGKW